MLRPFHKLCQMVEITAIRNFRKYFVTSVCRFNQKQPVEILQDIFTGDTFETPIKSKYTSEKDISEPYADDFLDQETRTRIERESKIKVKKKGRKKFTDDMQNKINHELNNTGELIIKSKRPELNFYSNMRHKKFEEMAIVSKGWQHYKSKGDYFTVYPFSLNDTVDESIGDVSFSDFDLNSKLLENVGKLALNTPTRIQKYGIPEVLAGKNTIITAETGCGKTFTYLIPVVEQILKWKVLIENRPYNAPLVVVITPSRELTAQIASVAKKLTYDMNIDIHALYGGRTKLLAKQPPVKNVDILIGTIGVLCKMTTWKIFTLDQVRHVVLDEAHALFQVENDNKLDMFLRRLKFGFAHPKDRMPTSTQISLASATMPPSIPEYFEDYIDKESLVEIKTPNAHRIMVPQKFIRVGGLEKPRELLELVKKRAARKAPTLVFSKNAETSDWISIFLNSMNVKTIHLNGKMPVFLRKDKYKQFLCSEAFILSTTSSAAHGLDTTMVDLVINYDFPVNTADYVHRCGRTGRMGGVPNGRVINFVTRKFEIELTQKIERLTRRKKAMPMFDIFQVLEPTINQDLKMLLNHS